MPAPGSEIPSLESVYFLTAISRAGVAPGRARALRAYEPSVPETEFKKRFPLAFRVRAMTIYDAQRKAWPTDRSYWQFLAPFQYVSPQWGPIYIPKGFYTDFASVPASLHSIIDDDSPIILFPSAPHDCLFTKRDEDGNPRMDIKEEATNSDPGERSINGSDESLWSQFCDTAARILCR